MTTIRKVAHVVLGVRDPAQSIPFYTEALGMECVNHIETEELNMAFFSFGTRDHDIAVVKVPDGQPVGSSGVAHTALEIEGGAAELGALYARLKQHGVAAEFAADHMITTSIYFLDPDGNRLEIFSQDIPEGPAKQALSGLSLDRAFRPLDADAIGR